MAEQTTEQQRAAGWKRDPWRRFAGRYWDGAQWTGHVVTEERVRSIDPPPSGLPASQGVPQAPREVESPPPAERRTRSARRAWPRWAQWSLCLATGALIIGAVAEDRFGDEPRSAANQASGTCQAADAPVRRLLEGLKGGAAALRRANAVTLDPPVGQFRFVVAAEIDGPGALAAESRVGAWASSAADGSGLLLALDEDAQRYSTWGEAASGANVSEAMRVEAAARPEVETAKACVRG